MRQPNTYVLLLSITSYSVILKGTSAKKNSGKIIHSHTEDTHRDFKETQYILISFHNIMSNKNKLL